MIGKVFLGSVPAIVGFAGEGSGRYQPWGSLLEKGMVGIAHGGVRRYLPIKILITLTTTSPEQLTL